MPTALEAVEAEALKLSPEEREALIERLVASVVPAELSPAWQAEIDRRLDDLQGGRTQAVPADEVFGRMEEKLRRAGG